MKTRGWGRALVVLGLTLAATALPADADYVLSIAGVGTTFADRDPDPAKWGVRAGDEFQIAAVLSGSGPHDSAIFDVGVTGPRSLIDNKYLWGTNYTSGSLNDFSVPKVDIATGLFPAGLKPVINNALYAFTPSRADMHFENLTNDGTTFGAGTLVTMNLKVPADAVLGEQFVIAPFFDTFALGFDGVPTTNGSSLTVKVVPEPATLVLLGLGGMAAVRRRLLG